MITEPAQVSKGLCMLLASLTIALLCRPFGLTSRARARAAARSHGLTSLAPLDHAFSTCRGPVGIAILRPVAALR